MVTVLIESMIAYSRGITARSPESKPLVQRHAAIASWRLEDWDQLETNLKGGYAQNDSELMLGELLLKMNRNTDYKSI